MQWTRLPKTDYDYSLVTPVIGLLGNVSEGRYHVIKLSGSTPSQLRLRVFDSKRGKWRDRCIEHQPWSQFAWCPTQCQGLAFNGALHWLAQDGPIVAYNPNFRRKECIFIHRIQEMRHASYGADAVVSETLTVSDGHLRIIQLVCYPLITSGHHLSIWTLVDYKQSIWKQEHDPTYFSDMASDLTWIQDYMRGYKLETAYQHNISFFMRPHPGENSRQQIICPQPLYCHPNNPLVVYLYLPESIVSLDVATKKLRLITRVRKNRVMGGSYWNRYDKVIPMTLVLDPSLVPDHERVLLPPS
ncbi:hypothetical protein EUTSA_v10015397mg [Eutrema salsugineum]|uniref:F-box associated domain-containing protein n=1 Tax=Eutrema salsugineum TaxID=72664 RepID=V4LSI7_EUTSA|nr:uncharacterized protein LOC18019187 [Eutrema salsugineum]ESQ42843.1 hypothetical protein EUTSA_v10015397mg [Eutrema salsugineum]